MSQPSNVSQEWEKARLRAELYLSALRGELGPVEENLVESALASARVQARLNDGAHPITLVMEALVGFLPANETLATPPIQRSRMLPEPLEFPVHQWMARLFGRTFAH